MVHQFAQICDYIECNCVYLLYKKNLAWMTDCLLYLIFIKISQKLPMTVKSFLTIVYSEEIDSSNKPELTLIRMTRMKMTLLYLKAKVLLNVQVGKIIIPSLGYQILKILYFLFFNNDFTILEISRSTKMKPNQKIGILFLLHIKSLGIELWLENFLTILIYDFQISLKNILQGSL